MNSDLGNTYQVGGPVDGFTIVTFGSKMQDEYGQIMPSVMPAASSTDVLVGIVAKIPPQQSLGINIDKATGAATPVPPKPITHVDVIHAGLAFVRLGGAVVNGDFITSDASGRGVRARPGDRYIAVALDDCAAGECVEVVVQIGQIAASTARSR